MLPEDSRCIAETHYQIGVAQGFNLQFDEAVASLEGAIKCLQTRIDKLKSKTESIGKKLFHYLCLYEFLGRKVSQYSLVLSNFEPYISI